MILAIAYFHSPQGSNIVVVLEQLFIMLEQNNDLACKHKKNLRHQNNLPKRLMKETSIFKFSPQKWKVKQKNEFSS